MANEEEARNPQLLARLCAKTGANGGQRTPSLLMQQLEVPEMRAALSKFGMIFIGGEKFPGQLFTRLRELTDCIIINNYGPTETTIASNSKIVTEIGSGPTSVGPPESGVLEQIMDMDGNPLPVGVVGELWIGGSQVALDYLGRPELTAERFVTWNGERYYRSGDLAKWNREGEVLILGRNDSQIKLRGLRIELGEIKNAIAACKDVTRAVLHVVKIRGQEHLCAYYTAEREIEAGELRRAISETLPKYMVPTAYKQMEKMPVTPNGKVDVSALPEPALSMDSDYKSPMSETEKAVCEVFSETIGLEKVGACDNFFDLGGTSLLVTRVVISLSGRGHDIAYRDMFQNPTPRSLAASLGGETFGPPTQAEPGYDYGEIDTILAANDLNALTGSGGRVSAGNRLKTLLTYYFDDNYEGLWGSRIIVVDGYICDRGLYEKLDAYPIDTYIDCAANVKHFSEGTDIEDINIGGAVNAIAFSQKKAAASSRSPHAAWPGTGLATFLTGAFR